MPPPANAPRMMTSAEIAAFLRRSVRWFYRHRRQLHALGLPQPAPVPGHPRWHPAGVYRWLEGPMPATSAQDAPDTDWATILDRRAAELAAGGVVH